MQVSRLPQRPATSDSIVSADELRDRLRILVLVTAGAFAVIAGSAGIIRWTSPEAYLATQLAILGLQVLPLCGVVLVLLRRMRSPHQLARLGVLFSVGVALCMAVSEASLSEPTAGGISGIGIWIILTPLVFPAGPRQAIQIAVASASTAPAVHVASVLLGAPALDAQHLLAWFLPQYFCAGLAAVAAFSLHRYRLALAQARRAMQELGRYELVRPLGRGGMGEVWLARHRLLPRQAAIKLVSRPDDGATFDHQFKAEASAIAQLTSPHTVTLYDYGISDDGAWYYVMELLDGIDLQQAVDRHGPLPDWRVARILAQVCRSLAEAHDKGLVHRDIKPGNLMLCRIGGELDHVKVVDFGLVGLGAGRPDQAEASTWAGTAGYVAPEVISGDGGDGDARADLYALGCVGWFLLSGARVFPEARNPTHECALHLTQEPPPTLLRSGQDADLVRLIHALLAKSPDQRPADARTVLRLLGECGSWYRYDEAVIARWWTQFAAGSSTA